MHANGLAKLRGRFKRAILSIRQVSKPNKYIFQASPFNWLAGVS